MHVFANFIMVKPIDVIQYPFRTNPLLALICALMPFLSHAIPGQNKTSISFIENKGQIIDQNSKLRHDIDARMQANGVNIFIGDGQIHYQWSHEIKDSTLVQENPLWKPHYTSLISKTEFYRLDVTLTGANPDAVLEKESKQQYSENYYLEQCPNGIAANSFQKLVYKNIYPNIDWILYAKNGELKYDFVVYPGGDIRKIRLKYEGASSLKLKDGGLVAETPFGSITEQAPYCYDATTGKEIRSSFSLKENELSFHLDQYESTNTIVIDPKLMWATYYGGSSDEFVGAITEDSFGHLYIAGCTNSTANIATSGAHLNSYSGGVYDAFLTRFTKNDNVVWSTYYGGNGIERGSSVACDRAGNVFLAGATGITVPTNTGGSTGLATAGTHQTFYRDSTDIFLVKFDSNGQRQWATYYGGNNVDDNGVLACDTSNNVYLAGWTKSSDSIATPGAFQTTHPGGGSQYDAFLAKFDASGALLWGTYYGGESIDWARCIAFDPTGYIYIAGLTQSMLNITGSGASNTVNGPQDGFVARFNQAGTFKWGMYYGGDSTDEVRSISCYQNGDLMLGGTTNSPHGIAAGICYQASKGGKTDAFVGRLSSSGNKIWCTYLGGPENEEMSGVATNPFGSLYASIRTESATGLPVIRAFQTSKAGTGTTGDAFIASFYPEGYIETGSYFGGSSEEHVLVYPGYGNANIIFSKFGNLYTCGNTSSQSGITYGTVHQGSYGGGSYDGYVAKIAVDTTVEIVKPFIDTLKCVGDSMYVTIRTSNYFNAGNVFTAYLSDSSGSFDNNTTIIGTRTSIYDGDIITHIPGNQIPGAHYKVRVVSTSPKDTSDDDGRYIRISQYPIPSASSNAPICEGASLNLFVTSPVHIEYYLWLGPDGFVSTNFFPTRNDIALTSAGKYVMVADNFGCKAKDSISVFIKPRPAKPQIVYNDTSFCVNDSLWLTTPLDTGISFTWQTPVGYFPFTPNTRTIPHLTMADSGIYRLATVFNYNNCPSKVDTLNIAVHPYPVPAASINSPICSGESIHLKVFDTTYQVGFTWTGPAGFGGTAVDTTINNSNTQQSGTYVVKANAFNCISKDTVELLVKQTPPKPSLSSNSPICSGEELKLNAADSITVNYVWSGPDNFNTNNQNSTISNATLNNSGRYKVIVSSNGCYAADSINVVVKPTPKPDIKANSPIIIGGDLYLQIQDPQSGYSYRWIGPNGFASSSPNPVIKEVTIKAAGIYSLTVTADGCEGTDELSVDIKAPDTSYFILYPNPNNGNFTIKGHTKKDQDMPLRIMDAVGKLVYRENVPTVNRIFKHDISLPSAASGIYLFQIKIDTETKNIPFTIKR